VNNKREEELAAVVLYIAAKELGSSVPMFKAVNAGCTPRHIFQKILKEVSKSTRTYEIKRCDGEAFS
jgi:hypothetical protein